MSIGGENRVGHTSRNALKRYAQANDLSRFGLGEAACVELMAELAQDVLDNLDGAFDDAQAAPGADELREHLGPPAGGSSARQRSIGFEKGFVNLGSLTSTHSTIRSGANAPS